MPLLLLSRSHDVEREGGQDKRPEVGGEDDVRDELFGFESGSKLEPEPINQ